MHGGMAMALLRSTIIVSLSLWAAMPEAMAGTGFWTSNGPYGGRVDSAAVGPAGSARVYATAGRSVFRSVDGGQTWFDSSAGVYTLEPGTGDVEAHPSIDGRALLAGGKLVFLTTNGARSWVRSAQGLPFAGNSFRAVDVEYARSAPTRVYLATKDAGLFRSTDGGATWSAVAGNSSLPPDLQRVAVDPGDPNRILVWAAERDTQAFVASLYRSTDGGINFAPVTGPWNSSGAINSELELLDFNGNTPGTVFLAGRFGNFRSLDGGLSFSALPPLPSSASQVLQSLSFDPTVPGRVFFGTSQGVLLSTNNGGSYSPLNNGLNVTAADPASIGELLLDPANSTRLLAFSLSGEVFATLNSGNQWLPASQGLRGTEIATLAVHPARAQRVFAGLRNRRTEAASPALYFSDDLAQTWTRNNQSLLLDSVSDVLIDPATAPSLANTVVYAVGEDFAPIGLAPTSYRGGLFRSINGGATWAAVDNLLPLPAGGAAAIGSVNAIAMAAQAPGSGPAQTLYFAARGRLDCSGSGSTPSIEVPRLWRSTDAATSWQPRDGLPAGTCQPRRYLLRPVSLAAELAPSSKVFVGMALEGYDAAAGNPLPPAGGGLFVSTNGGATWSPANNGLPTLSGGPQYDVQAIALNLANPSIVYVAVNPPGGAALPGRIYKSTDGGANFSAADNGIVGGRVRALAIDPANGNRVFAAVQGGDTNPGGVFISENAGSSWDSLSIRLPVDSALALAISRPAAGPPTIHAGTLEGVFSLTREVDRDRDGPLDSQETLAPGGGDGNGDGTPDVDQAGVASIVRDLPAGPAPEGGTTTTTIGNVDLFRGSGGACTQIYDAHAVDPLTLPIDDFNPQPRGGLIRFELFDCSQAVIEVFFHGETYPPGSRFRRFGPTSIGNALSFDWFDMGNAATLTPTRWTLNIVDNGPGDLRSEVGRILFIGGPAFPDGMFQNGFE